MPSHRPTWLVMLSSMTLVYGGLLLVSGLTVLRDPQAAARMPDVHPHTPAQEQVAKRLGAVKAEIVARHTRAARVQAVVSLAVALVMLYAAASTLSRDRNGRRVTMLAAWLGIAYQIATIPLVLPTALDYARLGGPLLAELMEAAQPEAARNTTPEAVTALVKAILVAIPVVTALFGIAASALLLAYFGGPRGRVLYGIEPDGGKR